jgi:hypothetical protein
MSNALRLGVMATACLLLSGSLEAAVTGMAASHDLRREGGRLCMSSHSHSGYGTGKTKSSARRAAIRSWAEFTTFEYGRRWGSYSRSRSKSTRYTKEVKGWSATVEGRPCRR